VLPPGALAALVGASIWFSQSTFVPFATDPATISYTFCSAPAWLLAADVLGVWTLLQLAIWAVERSRASRQHASGPTPGPSFAALALTSTNLAALGLLWPRVRDWWTPVAYVADSLHPWIWLLALGLVGVEIDRAGGGLLRRLWRRAASRVGSDGRRAADLAVVTTVLIVIVASSPAIRFSSTPIGDEPKYLRYAENWWQGRGMDVDGIQDASAARRNEGPHLFENFKWLGPALTRDVAQLGTDARRLTRAGTREHGFNRAQYAGNWMLRGQHGGLYQMHQPGISLALLPGYVVDRWLFDTGKGRFADDLFTVNLTLLLILATLAGVLFRMLDALVADATVAAVATVACVTSLPLSAFAFQVYPETLGALFVTLVSARLVKPGSLGRPGAAGLGLVLGWLVWLHVRFVPVAALLFVLLAWTFRRSRGAVAVLAATFAAAGGAFCLYAYHVTGSLLPTSLYAAAPTVPFQWRALPVGLLGTFFDRENGLFPLAPVYLLAVPGLALLGRNERRLAAMVLLLEAAMIVPVAGEGYESAGTSPLRYMVVASPLLALPVAVWLRSARARPGAAVVSAVVLLVSIDSAVRYNLGNDKTITQTIAHGISGWDASLLFPLVRRVFDRPFGFDRGALLVWAGALAVSAAAAAKWSTPPVPTRAAGATYARIAAACVAAIALAGGLAIAGGGPWRELRLLVSPADAEEACRLGCTSQSLMRVGDVPSAVRTR
jgi:hypothetical protein